MQSKDTISVQNEARNKNNAVSMLFEVDESDRKRLKRAAALSDMTMKDFMLLAVDEKIRNDNLFV